MASEKGHATGLDDTQARRRTNVPSTSPTNGGLVNRIEADDKKTQAKKVSISNIQRGSVMHLKNSANMSIFHRKSNRC